MEGEASCGNKKKEKKRLKKQQKQKQQQDRARNPPKDNDIPIVYDEETNETSKLSCGIHRITFQTILQLFSFRLWRQVNASIQ